MRTSTTAAVLLCVLAVAARADRIKNENFEHTFEKVVDIYHWGEHGEVFGAVTQISAGSPGQPSKAKAGHKMLVFDVAGSSWNGLWQEV
ncbi:MAG TPA: hypothetical protein VIH35_00695, partial [Kiritimatiellia bacterium]